MIDKAIAKATFLTDNDPGGEKLRANLEKAGVESRYIFSIGDPTLVLTVEDLVEDTVWLEAVNAMCAQSNKPKIESAPPRGRVDALPAELKGRKIDIAYAILDAAIRNTDDTFMSEVERLAPLFDDKGKINWPVRKP